MFLYKPRQNITCNQVADKDLESLHLNKEDIPGKWFTVIVAVAITIVVSATVTTTIV